MFGHQQFVQGYLLLLPDPVVPDLNALTPERRSQFLLDMSRLGDALMRTTSPLRINYAIYGNLEPALHAHVIPRYRNEPEHLRTQQPVGVRLECGAGFRRRRRGAAHARRLRAELAQLGSAAHALTTWPCSRSTSRTSSSSSRGSGSCVRAACSAAVGLYSGELFFGLIDDDTLFFKTDEHQQRRVHRAQHAALHAVSGSTRSGDGLSPGAGRHHRRRGVAGRVGAQVRGRGADFARGEVKAWRRPQADADEDQRRKADARVEASLGVWVCSRACAVRIEIRKRFHRRRAGAIRGTRRRA